MQDIKKLDADIEAVQKELDKYVDDGEKYDKIYQQSIVTDRVIAKYIEAQKERSNIVKNYDELLNTSFREEVTNQIKEDEIKEQLSKKHLTNATQEALYSTDDELGFVMRNWGTVKFVNGTKIDTGLVDLGIMPRKLYDLVRNYDIGLKHKILVYEGSYDERSAQTSFRPYGQCTKEQQKLIDKRKKDVEKFRKQVEQDKTHQYDKKGYITLPIYEQGKHHVSEPAGEVKRIIAGEMSEQEFLGIKDSITIPMTQRELARIGLLPEDFKWQERSWTEITRADIADADKEQELTTTEVGGIRGLIDRSKKFFKGEK